MKFVVGAFIITTMAVASDYSNRDLAVLIHNRIAAVPPSEETLNKMVKLLEKDEKQQAAALATDNPNFYNIKLLDLFTGWSNVAGNNRADLNDMTATLIGIVRDNQPFTEALTGDYLYVFTPKDDPKLPIDKEINKKINKHPYAPANNNHYQELQQIDLQSNLNKTMQTKLHQQKPFNNKAIAGVLSSRGFAEAYYSAGTNRRATAFVLKYFLCHDMESLHDTTDVNDSKVRKDIDRQPGGDPQLFRNRCIGCHAGLDALSGWNLYYDFRGALVYDKDKPLTCDSTCRGDQPLTREMINKINFNDAMKGKVADVRDDSFTNYWTTGQNAALGWGTETSGNGAQDWGGMIVASQAFATCMATHVYQHVCMVTPASLKEKNLRNTLAEKFRNDNFNMKNLFAMTAAGCLPGEK